MRYHITDMESGRTCEVEGTVSPAEAAHAGASALRGVKDEKNGDWEVRTPVIAEDWNIEVANLDSTEKKEHRDHFYAYPRRNRPVTERAAAQAIGGPAKVTVHDAPVPANADTTLAIGAAVRAAVAEAMNAQKAA